MLAQAVTLRPDWPDAHITLARIQLNFGEALLALSSYQAAAKLQPDHPDLVSQSHGAAGLSVCLCLLAACWHWGCVSRRVALKGLCVLFVLLAGWGAADGSDVRQAPRAAATTAAGQQSPRRTASSRAS